MILITDSNILVSALIKPKGTTASILKQKSNLQFTAPDYIFEELREHWDKVVASSDLTEKQLKEELKYYKGRIKLSYVSEIPTSTLLKAHALVDDIDEDDTFFIALHLHTGHKIWSGDEKLKKGLTKKGYGHFFTSTEELKKHLYKKATKKKK
jgi:hypothetical protein